MTTPPPAVAWVESPLQFVGAAEYAAATGRRILVAFRLGAQMSTTAAELLDRDAPFSSCTPYVSIPWSELTTARHWVIGDALSGQFHVAAAIVRPAAITLLDDGDMSIRIASSLAGDTEFERPGQRHTGLRRFVAEATRELLLRRALTGDLEFSSVYGVEHPEFAALADARVRLRRNEFAWTRASANPTDLPADTVVLGTAGVADGLIDENAHRRWVAAIAEQGPIAYLPHRREPDEHVRRIDTIPGVTTVHSGLPVELVLAGQRDLDIITSGSSAAATLALVLEGSGSRIRSLPVVDVVR